MTESIVRKNNETRRKYNFYMDIRKKLITVMLICAIGITIAGIAVTVKYSLAAGIFTWTVCLFTFIVPMYIIERIWTMVNHKTRMDFIDGM